MHSEFEEGGQMFDPFKSESKEYEACCVLSLIPVATLGSDFRSCI